MIGSAKTQATVEARKPSPYYEARPDPRRSAVSADGPAKISTDAADLDRRSSEPRQFADATPTRPKGGGGGDGFDDRDPPDWLAARRRCLDNQILRRQLRCQRADALVAEQFNVVHKK